MIKPYLEVGEFVTTHGIAGEIKLYPWSDDAAFLERFTTLYLDERGKNKLKIEQLRVHKGMCLIKLEHVNTVENARSYVGKIAYIDRKDAELEPGQVFVQDLLEMKVVDAETGQQYGVIKEVTHPGRHDIYAVADAEGNHYLFPAVEPFLQKIEIDTETVYVSPIPGMFEKEAEPAKKSQKKQRRRKPVDTD